MSLAVDELSVDEKSVDKLSVDGLSPHRQGCGASKEIFQVSLYFWQATLIGSTLIGSYHPWKYKARLKICHVETL